jgi:hypothetical protein
MRCASAPEPPAKWVNQSTAPQGSSWPTLAAGPPRLLPDHVNIAKRRPVQAVPMGGAMSPPAITVPAWNHDWVTRTPATPRPRRVHLHAVTRLAGSESTNGLLRKAGLGSAHPVQRAASRISDARPSPTKPTPATTLWSPPGGRNSATTTPASPTTATDWRTERLGRKRVADGSGTPG